MIRGDHDSGRSWAHNAASQGLRRPIGKKHLFTDAESAAAKAKKPAGTRPWFILPASDAACIRAVFFAH